MAVRIVSILLGFIAAVVSYPYYDNYVLAIIALIGAIATGIVVFMVAERLLADATK